MADNEKGTIYQRLNKLLNLDGFGFQDEQPSVSQNTPSPQSKVIIKGQTPEEIHRKGLELEQKENSRINFSGQPIEVSKKHFNMKQPDFPHISIMREWNITQLFLLHWIYLWKKLQLLG